jgi:hypothetical protein
VSRRFKTRKLTGLVTLAVAAIAAASAYAFTASNAIPNHDAGVGEAVMSGFTVANDPAYTWNVDGTLHSIELVLDKNAHDLKLALVDDGTTPVMADWTNSTCVAQAPDGQGKSADWICTYGAGLSQITVETLQNSDLYFAAVGNGSVTLN